MFFSSLFLDAADETAVKRSRGQEGEDVANRLWTPEEKRLPGVYSSQRAPVCLVQQGGVSAWLRTVGQMGGVLRKSFFCGYSQRCSGGGGYNLVFRVMEGGNAKEFVAVLQKRIACFWAVFVILKYK